MEIKENINIEKDSSKIDPQTIAQLVPPWQLSSSTLQKIRDNSYQKENNKKEGVFLFIKCRYILLFTIFFSSISLFFLKTKGLSKNIIIFYYSNLVNYFLTSKNTTLLLFFLFIVLTLVMYFFDYHMRGFKSSRIKLFQSILTTTTSLLLGFFVSFPTLLLIGYIHLNLIAGYSSLNPDSSIIYGANEVANKLKQMRNSPTIDRTDDVAKDLLTLLTKKQTNKFSAYYSNHLLDYIPDQLIYTPKVPNVSLLMFEDKLLFRSIEDEEIKVVSPILGKLLVMDYLKGRYVKDEPLVVVLGRQDFYNLEKNK